MRSPDPYEPGPHRSDDAPDPPRPPRDEGLRPVPRENEVAMLRRNERRFSCLKCGERVSPDDPDHPPKPLRPAWREGAVLEYPCPCGGAAQVTTRDLIVWLRTDRTGRGVVALRNLDAAAEMAKQAQKDALAAKDFSAAAANGALLARIEQANLKMGGVLSEQVEVTHRFAPSEDDPEVQAMAEAIARREWDRLNKVQDAEVVPPKGPA